LIEESICGEDDKERGTGGEARRKGKERNISPRDRRERFARAAATLSGGDRRFDRARGGKRRRRRGLARKEDEPGPPLRFAASRKQDRPRDGGIDGGGLRWNAVVRFNDSELRP